MADSNGGKSKFINLVKSKSSNKNLRISLKLKKQEIQKGTNCFNTLAKFCFKANHHVEPKRWMPFPVQHTLKKSLI